jgi:hypothetical protein
MISKSKQDWAVGATVKVGFLSLTVLAAIATPGDFKPDAYVLKNAAGTQLYRFVPHNGLEKLSLIEAREMYATAKVAADRAAAAALAKAQEASREIVQINELIFA